VFSRRWNQTNRRYQPWLTKWLVDLWIVVDNYMCVGTIPHQLWDHWLFGGWLFGTILHHCWDHLSMVLLCFFAGCIQKCTYCASSPQSSTNAASFLAIASVHTTEKVIWYTGHRDNTLDNATPRPHPSPPALASQQCKNNNKVQCLKQILTSISKDLCFL